MTEIRPTLEAAIDEFRETSKIAQGTPEWIAVEAISSFARQLLDIVAAGRLAGATAMRNRATWTCCCRCRDHGKIACPICLAVEGCPVHATPDERVLRPDDLLDPERIASAFFDAFAEEAGPDSGHPYWNEWDDPEGKELWIGIANRVVVSRAARRK